MPKEDIPSIRFYDQDFVDMYTNSWNWISNCWTKSTNEEVFNGSYLSYENQKTYNLFHNCLSSLFLNYGNLVYSPFEMIDFFYSKQEENGAIRCNYDMQKGSPVFSKENPQGLCIPLLAYVELFFYHKLGNKKRLKEIVPSLDRYFDWLCDSFQQPNGLFFVPSAACESGNIPRLKEGFLVDFNAAIATNALYFAELADILNDKEIMLKYKKLYFSLKTRINEYMWDEETGFYHDLDAGLKKHSLQYVGAYWTLLAEIPNEDKASSMIKKLKDENEFGTDNPFPSVSVSSSCYKENAEGYISAVIPFNTYVVIKGLEKYNEFIFARECAIRHLYFILDTLNPGTDVPGDVWEAYLPTKEGVPAPYKGTFPAKHFLPQACLITITLMIENIIGLSISLPRKTVDWTVPNLEIMGIENLSLKRNYISIISNKNTRGWEIRLESEKLYYFTIIILEENKKKTLPIPSGKCFILIDKL